MLITHRMVGYAAKPAKTAATTSIISIDRDWLPARFARFQPARYSHVRARRFMERIFVIIGRINSVLLLVVLFGAGVAIVWASWPSSPFRQNNDMKWRLFPPCGVASPCRIPHTATGLRLAWQKNPSVSFDTVLAERTTSSQWQRRGAIEVAGGDTLTQTPVFLHLEAIQNITGANAQMMLLSAREKSGKFSSGSGYSSETRNVLFLTGTEKSARWLFPKQNNVVLEVPERL